MPQGKSWVQITGVTPLGRDQHPHELASFSQQEFWRMERRDDVVFLDLLNGYLGVLNLRDTTDLTLSAEGDGAKLDARIDWRSCCDGIGRRN